ncbi:cell wall-active antibiotics response protein LiaF [Cohnella cellulosilytica]|uniref:Cell wall-active antibiotics response protein LiaF n=1 Tax=Cohnella cellulosilytica TaxID=986710 RepID=A0ABW2FA55_9BACL
MNSSIVHRLLWGAFIVVVGVVFLLNQVGLISMDIGELFRTYWPVFLIVFGLQGMLLQQVWWNLLTVIIGCYFLGRNLGYLDWSFGDFARILGPIAIILFGLSLIFRGNRPGCGNRHSKHEGWNPVHPGSPYEPPEPNEPQVPPVPPGPPPAPPELEEFERRSSINLDKEPQQERPNDYGFSRGERTPPPPNPGPDPADPYDSWPNGAGRREWRDWKHAYKHAHNAHRHAHNAHRHAHNAHRHEHSRFIGDVHLGNDYWELRPMNISHFIGDTTLDLTKAQIPVGETRVYVSSFIGDVKVFVPNDLGVGIQVVSSSLIGDVKVLGQKRGGLFNQMTVETPLFPDADKRVVLIVSSFIGDVRVTKVG